MRDLHLLRVLRKLKGARLSEQVYTSQCCLFSASFSLTAFLVLALVPWELLGRATVLPLALIHLKRHLSDHHFTCPFLTPFAVSCFAPDYLEESIIGSAPSLPNIFPNE